VNRTIALICGAILVALAAAFLWQRVHAPPQSGYLLINETDQHDFDLAFRMSLRLAERKSGIDNVLVLLKSLPPSQSIEQVATELVARMRVGARHNGRGILYVYSTQENLLKVEVTFALEGDIPDAYCRRLEEAAKTYMLSEVPQDFISELIITTNLRGMGSKDEADVSAPSWAKSEFLSGGGGALTQGYRRTLQDYQQAILKPPAAEILKFAPSAKAEESLQRYLDSLAAGIGDPRLPLLTEGSRIFRVIVPRNQAQQLRISNSFSTAGSYRLLFAGDLGLAVAGPGKSNLPIVLRRGSDALWYVDEPKSWTYFHRFEDNQDFFVKYADNVFLPELRVAQVTNMDSVVFGTHVGTPKPPVYPYALEQTLLTGEEKIRSSPASAQSYAELADLYLFEMNWLTRAVELYEKASALAPQELAYRWRLVDVYLNTSRAEKMLAELRFLAEHLPRDKQTQDWYQAYVKAYELPSSAGRR
jgi:hypothetical protein